MQQPYAIKKLHVSRDDLEVCVCVFFPMENKLLLPSENDSELLLRLLFWKVI